MFRTLEMIFAALVMSAMAETCTLPLTLDLPNGVRRAASQLAALVNCSPDRLVWTSGATESNNLAIIGAARYRSDRGHHLVTMPTEHKAVTDVFRALERQGFDVTWIEPASATQHGGTALFRKAVSSRPTQSVTARLHVSKGVPAKTAS